MRDAVIACALAAAAVASGWAQGLVEWQENVVSGVGVLRLAVPEGWTAESHAPAPGTVKITLVPRDGAPARVLIIGTASAAEPGLKSTGDIKRAARSMGEAMLPGSMEEKIGLERVDGTDGSGFFYTLTDRRPELPEGEFRVTTQGIMAVGALRLAVTVLSQEKDSPAARVAFAMLRTAECRPAGR